MFLNVYKIDNPAHSEHADTGIEHLCLNGYFLCDLVIACGKIKDVFVH